MAKLIVNEHTLDVLGSPDWLLESDTVAGEPAYIEALVDASQVNTPDLDVAGALVRLALSDKIVEGRNMAQVSSLATDGSGTIVRFEGIDVREVNAGT